MWGWEIVKSFRLDEEFDESLCEEPKRVIFQHRFRELFCGSRFTAAVDCEIVECTRTHHADHSFPGQGKLFTWGIGTGGRLGHGDDRARVEPTLVEGLAGYVIVRVALGKLHMLALTGSSQQTISLGASISTCNGR